MVKNDDNMWPLEKALAAMGGGPVEVAALLQGEDRLRGDATDAELDRARHALNTMYTKAHSELDTLLAGGCALPADELRSQYEATHAKTEIDSELTTLRKEVAEYEAVCHRSLAAVEGSLRAARTAHRQALLAQQAREAPQEGTCAAEVDEACAAEGVSVTAADLELVAEALAAMVGETRAAVVAARDEREDATAACALGSSKYTAQLAYWEEARGRAEAVLAGAVEQAAGPDACQTDAQMVLLGTMRAVKVVLRSLLDAKFSAERLFSR